MAEIEERAVRIAKLQALREQGVEPYPAQSRRTATCAEALSQFEAWSEAAHEITVAGRLKTIRRHGGSMFAHLEDGTEALQVFLSREAVGDATFDLFAECVDPGDFAQVTGTLFVTKRGERTLAVTNGTVLSKALLPLPEKWHGLSDVEVRYRQRYLDLIANAEVRQLFTMRSVIVRTIRDFFEAQGFLEVETPMLQAIPGGAIARPFVTHHNALDTDLYLRIAPELYLKRLIVGGFERVFEVARCFRNEGIDHSHNPEFTQVEAYMAYADYNDLMQMMEQLFGRLGEALFKDQSFEYKGHQVKLTAPFERVTFRDALMRYADIDIDAYPDLQSLQTVVATRGIKTDSTMGRGKILDELFKTFVREQLIQPMFVIDYPVELSPLAKRKAADGRYVEMFQLVIAGNELVKAFSELNDPQDQLARFEEQQGDREAGDEEAHRVDMDYVIALEHGMPPTAGLGVGIDRLAALLTNSHSLKEVILFPTLRPKQ